LGRVMQGGLRRASSSLQTSPTVTAQGSRSIRNSCGPLSAQYAASREALHETIDQPCRDVPCPPISTSGSAPQALSRKRRPLDFRFSRSAISPYAKSFSGQAGVRKGPAIVGFSAIAPDFPRPQAGVFALSRVSSSATASDWYVAWRTHSQSILLDTRPGKGRGDWC
jgi:hypothetical protein